MQSGCMNGHGGPCLQIGFCDRKAPHMRTCGKFGITGSLFRFSLPALPAGTTVVSADLYLNDVGTAACR